MTPAPAIALVREKDATDERVKEAYRDIKESLRVSFVHLMFQAYASDPKFLDHTWRRLRPSMLAPPFVEQARRIAELADEGVEPWPVGDHAAALHARNYGDNDLRKLREIAELFHSVNPRLLTIAYAVRVALTGEPVGGLGAPQPPHMVERDKLVRDFRGVRVPMADEREAPLRVRSIYEEIARATGQQLIATDYRAMGAFPDWLEVFWNDCKPLLSDARWRGVKARVDEAGQEAARQLPYPLNIAPGAFPEMQRVNDLFCDMLPALVVSAAVARRGLGPEPSAG